MLQPRCDDCGGLLESVSAVAGGSGDATALRAEMPHLSPAFGRLLRLVLFGLLTFSAARFGWDAGGAGLAVAAVGMVGLFTVPLIVGE
jgi:hypothetical protein